MANYGKYGFLPAIALCLLWATEVSWAQVKLVRMPVVEKGDTLLVGVFREADAERFNILWEEYNTLMEKQFNTEAKQTTAQMQGEYDNEGLRKKQAELEAKRSETLKALAQLPDSPDKQKMTRETNEAYDKMIAELPKMYGQVQRDLAAQDSKLTTHAPAEYSNEKKYAVKRRLVALAVGGRLYNYTKSRDFRHGRAAVARGERWGFIDEQGHLVVPCEYSQVFDFNNRKFYKSAGVFERLDDQDDRPWTTAWKPGEGMGMIDADGHVVIPFKFRSGSYNCIVFFKTSWGEFAPVHDVATGKYGIIGRDGNYSLRPESDNKIVWYTDVKSFGTTGENRVFFDPYGKKIETGDP